MGKANAFIFDMNKSKSGKHILFLESTHFQDCCNILDKFCFENGFYDGEQCIFFVIEKQWVFY